MNNLNQDKSLKYAKISVSLPTDLIIKLDLEKGRTNESRSAWIKRAIESSLGKKDSEIDKLKEELNELKQIVLNN